MYKVYTSRFSYNCGKLFPVSRNLNIELRNFLLLEIIRVQTTYPNKYKVYKLYPENYSEH